MNLYEVVPIIIGMIATIVSAFLGSFCGYKYSMKKSFCEDKKQIYYKLIEYLPASIILSQDDMDQMFISSGSPECSIRIIETKIEVLEKDLTTPKLKLDLKNKMITEIANLKSCLKELEQYNTMFNLIISSLDEYETSSHYNMLKIYGSNEVRQAFVNFSVAIKNDYYSNFNISSNVLDSLLNKLIFAIREELSNK